MVEAVLDEPQHCSDVVLAYLPAVRFKIMFVYLFFSSPPAFAGGA